MNKLCDIPLGILVEGAIRINRELVHEKRYAIEWIETVKNCADNFYIDLNKNPDQLAVCINSRHSEVAEFNDKTTWRTLSGYYFF